MKWCGVWSHTLLGLIISNSVAASIATQRVASIKGVRKVIEMLTKMEDEGKKEKQAEEVAFAEFNTWCNSETLNVKASIKKEGLAIERLIGDISKLGSDIADLGQAISKLQSDQAKFEADRKAATEQRAKDHEAFIATEQDFSESVDAIDRALDILSQQNYDRPATADALLQLTSSSQLPARAKSIVETFVGMLQDDPADLDDGSPLDGMDHEAPRAHAYESQSGGVIEMLKTLQDEFRGKLSETQKDEMNSKHAFDMMSQDLADAIRNAKRDAEEKTELKFRKSEKKAKEENELKASQTTLESDQKLLVEVTTECTEKKMSFTEKQNLRAEELEAIAKAKEILASDKVTGNAEKHLSFAESSAGTAFLQSLAGQKAMTQTLGIHRRIREFIADEGKRLHSSELVLLSNKMLVDPFAKVKKLIDNMITRLMEEGNQDAEHEGFCDTEMGKNKVTRDKLTMDIDALMAAVEDGKATIMHLTQETADLSQEVNSLIESMTKVSELRSEEKKRNMDTITDAQEAQNAVTAAVAILKDFYAKASTATGFIQSSAKPSRDWGIKSRIKMGSEEWNELANPNFEGKVDTGHKEGMQTFGETEKGQQDEANYGVLGLLEVVLSDFTNVESETSANEETAAKEHERFMAECKKDQAVKEKKIALNGDDKNTAEAQLQQNTGDLKRSQDELLDAERYYKKLVPQCIDQGMTWDERVAARKAEINSLKEALTMLSSADVA